jgi:hypothetical protein
MMKTMIVSLALLGFVHSAQADIPIPHNPQAQSEVASHTYSGTKAEKKWNSIESDVLQGSVSGFTGHAESYKVERSEDGLKQTVCTEISNLKTHTPSQYSCTSQKSLNGEPLPKFVPVHHMG